MRLEIENDCHPTNLKHTYSALILGEMPDAPKLTLRHIFQSVWCNQLVEGLIGLHICILPRSHVSLKILPGPGLILAAAEPISKPQVRKDGSFLGDVYHVFVSCLAIPQANDFQSLTRRILCPHGFT